MSSDVIHETVIRDILDVVDDVRKSDYIKGMRANDSFKSISNASDALTLVFPVLTSRNISVENATMIAKAVERKAVSMLQMLFSAINITNGTNGIEYLKKFHTNLQLDDRVTVDGFISFMDKFATVLADESGQYGPMGSRRFLNEYNKIKEDLKHNIDYVLPESMNEISLSDYKMVYSKSLGKDVVLQIHEVKKGNTNGNASTAGNGKGSYHNSRNVNSNNKSSNNTNNSNNIMATSNSNNKSVTNNYYGSGGGRVYFDDNEENPVDYKQAKYYSDVIKNQLLDSDVKKANELVPTMMVINFVTNADTNPVQNSLVIGVKAKVYPIDSKDMIERLYSKNVDNNGFLKFVRATTREISFVKDFLFAIDKAKIDALSTSRKGSSSKLWKILERRTLKSRIRRALGQPNDASAISTLVISQEEVEYLKKVYNVHVDIPAVIRPIMEAYNLMAVCIVDELNEVANFIYDTGNDVYERVAFRSLERESADNDFRKMITLMTKMR